MLYLETAGDYKIQYVATDFSNNSATLEKVFTVEEITVDLADTVEEEYIKGIIYIPRLSLDSGISYYVERFELSDTNFENGERIKTSGLLLANPGSYNLRYVIFSGEETSVILTKIVIFKVVDREKPVIDEVTYLKTYDTGVQLEIKQPNANDNHKVSGAVSYKVFRDSTEITGEIKDGKLLLNKSGSYTIVYTAKDESGNIEEVTYSFNVEGKESNGDNSGCNSSINIGLGTVSILLAGVIVVLLLKRRKTND